MKKKVKEKKEWGKLSGRKRNRIKKNGIMDKKKGKNETNRNSSNIKKKWENKAISSKIAATARSTKISLYKKSMFVYLH